MTEDYRIEIMKMEAAQSSKMMVSNHHTTWHNNSENEFYLHHCGNLKYGISYIGNTYCDLSTLLNKEFQVQLTKPTFL
jgi:hypothetical protein